MDTQKDRSSVELDKQKRVLGRLLCCLSSLRMGNVCDEMIRRMAGGMRAGGMDEGMYERRKRVRDGRGDGRGWGEGKR